MRGERIGAAVIACAVLGACGGGGTPPKAPTESAKPAAREVARACTAPASSRGPKPLGSARTSSTIALASAGSRTIAYIADEDGHAVQTVDVDSHAELASTPLDGVPSHVLVLPDGRVLVTVKNKALVVVLEPDDKPESPLSMKCSVDTAAEPLTMALTPDDKTVLVVSGWGHTLTALSSDVLTKKFAVALAREPRAVVSSDDGSSAYISHAVGSKMSVVDLKEQKKTEIVLRGRDPSFISAMASQKAAIERMRADGRVTPEMEKKFEETEKRQLAIMTRPSVQGYALAKSISPPGRVLAPQVFVDPGDPSQRAEGYGHDGSPTESQNIAVIDEGTSFPFDASVNFARNHFMSGGADDPRDHHGACLLPRAAAVDAKTKTLLVTCFGLDDLVAFDAAAANPAAAEKRRWDVGGGPSGVAVDPVKHRAVVWAQFDRAINVVSLDGPDVADEKKSPQPEPITFGLTPLKNKLSAEIQLGRVLFHNANDSRIARDGRACASCHPDGRDDAITWATPLGPRRSIFLAGRVGSTPPYSWGGNEKTLHEHLHTTFDRLSGQGLRSLELDAIVAYVTTLAPPNEGGTLVAGAERDEKKLARGKEIFASSEAMCSSCHNPGTSYSDGRLHDVKSKTDADKTSDFNTPSLKGVGGTGPWFHDGRYATLGDLLKGVDGKMGKTKHLSEGDLAALETYLRTL